MTVRPRRRPRPVLRPGLWAPPSPPALTIYPPRVRRLIRRLRSPEQVQRWLNRLRYNQERGGETARTLPEVVRHGRAHCLEAAVAAAAILEHHGHPPVLMDIESVDLLDHVLFLYRRNGRYGVVARSRDPGLHGRKPVYRTLEALVRSYMAPYIDATGRIKGYGVFDLRRLRRVDWRASKRHVRAIEKALNDNRHVRLLTPDVFYRRWHARYQEFKRLHRRKDDRPTFYPGRADWLWP